MFRKIRFSDLQLGMLLEWIRKDRISEHVKPMVLCIEISDKLGGPYA
jgi:hypothetical protein